MKARYQAERKLIDGIEVIRLSDLASDCTASIVPSHGNNAYELQHGGANWLWCPFTSPAEMIDQKVLFGIPLLSPWANRLSSDTYCVGGAAYTLNRALNNLRVDSNYLAIHGLVMFAPWRVEELTADDNQARVRSSLQFTGHPRWMGHFPFAHRLQMEHFVREGSLHVRLLITNDSTEAMPISIGFHPWFALPTAERDDWQIDIPAAKRMLLDARSIPTGEMEDTHLHGWKNLAGIALDDVFTDLHRVGDDFALFRLGHGNAVLTAGFGRSYPVGVVYAPTSRRVVCFEPLAAPTDALHLAADGRYDHLPMLAPQATWSGHFWVKPEISSSM